MKHYLPILAACILLTGCSSASNPTPEAPDTMTPSAATESPTPEAATPQQFASIIAGKEADWRKVIKSAYDCRYLWVMGGKSFSEKIQATTCYVGEATIVLSTGTAAKQMRELTPSSDMQPLVDETLKVLDAISIVNIEGICGKAWKGPNHSKKCSRALGSLNWSYGDLDEVLDKWKPYT